MKQNNSINNWQSMESLEARLMLSGSSPTIVFSDTPYAINEGDSAVLNASGTTDPETDALTFNWDLDNDGTFEQADAGAQPTFSWAQLQAAGITDDGSYTIGLQVDDGTNQVTQTVTLTVSNTAPTATLTGDANVAEQASYALNVGISDPGDDTPSMIVVNWGDGSNAEVVSAGANSHIYESEGSYNITVSVMDEDGYHTNVSSKSVTVDNAAPTIINGASVSLASVNEDVASGSNAGQSVNSLFLPHYSDDADAFAGVAIVGNSADAATEGAWQYSTDGGTTWTAVAEAVDASTAIVLGPSHMLRFQPVANFAGTPGTLDVRLWDGGGTAVAGQANDLTGQFGGTEAFASSAITTGITVTALADAPSFSSSAVTDATEDVLYTYNITASDADAGDTLTITALAKPTWLTFTDAGDGTATLTGTPTNDEVGDHSISLQVADGDGNLATQSFTLTVANANDAPTLDNAIADQSATEDAAFSFQFSSDVFSDVDAADTLTYSATQADDSALPAWLTFTAGTRTFSGTPANGDVGTLSVKVTADDGNGGTVSDTFDITISNVNDAPTVANPIADQSATEDAAFSFQIPADAFNDVDAGDSLTYSATQADDSALPAWLTFTAGTRTFSGTPTNDDVGTISVKVTATDGSAASVTDTFNIVVANANDAPTLDNPIADQSATEDSAFSYTFPLNTFSDVDVSDTLTYTATQADDSALPAWLTFTAGTRTFSGTPANGDVGTVSVKVTADDGTTTVTDTFDITVSAVNDAPVITKPAAQTIDEDTTLTFSSGNGNAITLADDDSASADLALTLSVSNGTLTVVLDGTATVTAGSNASASMTITGTVTELNNTLEGMVYTPTADYDGGDVLSIGVDDGGNTGSGGALTDSETVAINFNSIDDATVVDLDANDSGGSSPDFATTYTENGAAATIVDVDAALTDVDSTNLASITITIASPAAGDTLSATTGGTSVTANYAGGVLTLTGPDTVANFQQVLRTVQYSNSGDNPGASKTITIVANDGNSDSAAATSTITITTDDDAPSGITNNGLTLNEGATATVTTAQLTVTDADSADSAITFTVVTAPSNGALKKSGTTLNATDTFTLADIVAGNITYVHAGGENVSDTVVFTYEDASSGAVGGNQNFNITVTPVNDAPVLAVDSPAAYTENAGATDIAVNPSITDAESDNIVSMTITITDFQAGDTLDLTEGGLTKNYAAGVLSLTGSASLATYQTALDSLTFTTASDDPGASRTITLVVNDNTDDSNTVTMTLNITESDDTPAEAANTGAAVDEDVSHTITAAELDFDDPDNTDTEIVYTVSTAPTHGTLYKDGVALIATNTFTQDDITNNLITYTNDDGTSDSFVFAVSDGTNNVAGQTFTLTVTPVNDTPVEAANTGLTLNEAATATISNTELQYTDAEQAAGSLTYTLDVAPTNGALKLSGTTLVATDTFTQADIDASNLTYVHDGGETTSDSFEFTLSDGAGGTVAGQTFSITVTAVNDDPVLTKNVTLTVNEGASGIVTAGRLLVLDNDVTTDAEIVFTVDAAPSNGTLYKSGVALGNGDTFTQEDIYFGNVTYTHDGGETTTDTFDFSVSDSAGGTIASTTFNITVTAQNDDPSITVNSVAVGASSAISDISEDDTITFSAANSNLIVVVDPDAAASNITVSLAVTRGTLNITDASGATISAGADQSAAMTLTGTVAQINTALDGMVYTPTSPGGETITFTLNDGGATGAGGGGDVTSTLTFSVNANPTIDANTGITLDEAATATIANTDLAVTDVDNTSAQLTYTVVTKPANGTLYNDGVALDNGGTFTQDDINSSLITYTHDGGETTADSFVFSVADGAGGTIGNTTFSITVNAINDAPVVGTNTGATFNEATTGNTVTSAMLEVTDAEQAAAARTFTLTAVPTNGTLKLSGMALSVGETFTQADIANSLLTYDHDGSETTSDSFAFTVADGDGGTIAETTFAITITPVNDTPVLATNTGVTLDEAATTTITSAMLALTDAEQAAGALTYTVVTKPANGTLYNDGVALDNGDTFTQADVDSNLITYTHDGGETVTDTLTFSVADGAGGTIGNTDFTFTVTAINDAPVLATNTGATFDEGATGNTVTSAMLEVTDAEQAAAARTFTLTAVPTNGTLKLSGTALSVGETFTQADIANSLLTYDHDDSETTSDSFAFTVADGDGGTIAETTFAITITAIDDTPTVSVNSGQTVTEDISSALTAAKLSYTDSDNVASELTYTITAITTHGTLYNNGVALGNGDTFTQADINAGLVTYTNHDGIAESFSFTVNDGTNTTAASSFSFTVAAANDLPSVSTNTGITLDEAATATIGQAELEYSDPEQGAIDLTYSLEVLPANGTLKLSGVDLALNDTFTQDDINNNLLTYVHDGSETTSDSFGFDISDGVGGNVTGQTFAITVTPVSDAPVEAVNAGLAVTEEVSATVSNAELSYTDVDNTAAQVTYTVTVKPAHGTLYNDGVALDNTDTFTQADIDNSLITYTNDDGENDGFTFTVNDGTTTTGAATFAFTTTAVNDAPTVDTNTGITLNEGATTTLGQAALETTDVEQAAAELTYTVTTLPTNGTLKLSGVDLALSDTFTQADVNNNLVTYVHDGSETTADSAVVTVSDGQGGSVAGITVSITVTPVNDDPTLAVNDGVTVTEGDTGTTLTSAMLQAADAEEADPANLTFTLSAVPTGGTLKLSGVALNNGDTFTQADINNSLLTYDHAGGESASDSFTFTVDDGSTGSLAGQTFAITVTPVNEDPTISFNGGAIGAPETLAAIAEEGSITFNAGNANLIAIADVDAAAGLLSVTLTATKGVFTLNAGATGALTNLSGDGAASVSFDGTVAQINAALDGMVYTAVAPNTGAETLTLTVNDNGYTGAVSGNDVTATLAVTINDAKSAPILDTSSALSLTAVNEDTASGSVAGNTLVEILATGAGGDPITLPDGTGSGEIKGIAVTGVDDANGTWQYSTDNGGTWTAFGAVADNAAVVLTPAATNKIRFVADADFAGTAGLTFRAWDSTDGSSNGDTAVDASTNGGTSAFSADAGTLNAPITNVNDAPVLDASTEMTLTAISEDVADGANTGMTVAAMLATGAGGDPITDIDPAATDGIAVIGVGNDNGSWEFSIDGGTSWTAFGSPGYMSATLLGATNLVRFVPDANWNGTASISFVAWDGSDSQASGTTGVNIATAGTGGIKPFSTAAASANLTVNPANDFPVLDDSGSPTLTGIDEDVVDGSNTGTLVSAMLASAAGGDPISDIDSGAVDGIAVTTVDDANGTWQFSTDGGTTWTAFGAVTESSAVVLTATANDKIRFVPAANYNGDATITFKAWDTTDANASGAAAVDASVTGDTVAFSTASETATITVAAVEDAPTLDNAIADQGATDDVAFSFTVAADAFSDVDTDDTLTYTATQADDSALPAWLSFDAATRTFSGTPADGDVGTLSVKVTADDGTSTVSDTFDIVVSDANDAPVLDTTEMTVTGIDEDVADGANTGMLVSDLLATGLAGDPISDADAVAVDGIAVTGVDDANGAWQYSTDGGTTWTAFGAVAESSAVLLTATANDKIRFVPTADYAGEATISFRAWDTTDAASSGDAAVDTTTNGATTAFSTAIGSARITVAAVNDAPTLDNAIADQGATDDAAFSFTVPANTFGDVDGDTLTYTATQADDSALPAWLSFDAGTRTFSGTPADGDVGTLSVKVTADDGTVTVSDTFDIVVADANDAPTLDIALVNQDATEDAAFSYSFDGASFSDVDAGDSLTYSASLADDSALPAWLSFDGASRTFSGTPANGDVGTITVKVTATDTASATANGTFTIAVANINDAPTVDAGIADQPAAEGSVFSFTVPADAFSDVDAGDSLTYAATLADDSALPSWLSFDAGARTFSGTPGNDAVGTLDVKVTATDGSDASVSDTFTITVANTNDAPTLDNPIADQNATEDAAFSFTFAADVFGDPDAGDSLTYTATLADDSALPAWLSFDGASRTFSGTPTNDDVGNLDVKVTATDTGSEFTTDTFTITVANTNDAPTVDAGIADQTATEDAAFSFTVPADAFSDVDAGDSLTYAATLADDSALPAWLSFDGASRTFSGTPTNDDVGSLDVKVTVTDGSDASISDAFTLTVDNTNDAPTVDSALVDQDATEDTAFSYSFDAASFGDVDAGDSLTYTATLADDSALPAWLSFDGASRTFSGTPENGDVGSLDVKVTADDGVATVSDTFTITVANTNDAPTVDSALVDQNATEDAAFSYSFDAASFGDVDAGDSLTYTATLADDSALPAWLSFDGASRTFSGTPTNDDVGSFDVKVTATDGSDASVSDTFTITVANTNDAPVIADQSLDMAEDAAVDDVVGTPVVTDVDAGDTLTYSISGGADAARFAIDAATGEITLADAAGVDYESVTSYTLEVTVEDAEYASDTATVTINVTNVNEAPSLTGGSTILSASAANGDVVAEVAVSDVDAGDTFTYAIISGNDAGAYAVNAAGQVIVADADQLEANTIDTLTVRVTDAGGLTDTAEVVVTVTSVLLAPTVTEVVTNASLLTGDSVLVRLTVANDGSARAGQAMQLIIVAVPDGGGDDVELYNNTVGTGIGAGGSRNYNIPLTIPSNDAMPIGAYTLAVSVQYGEIVSETTDDTALNVDPANVLITPTIVSSTLGVSTLPGVTGTVRVMLTNNGNIKATEPVAVSIYASADQAFGGDTEIVATAYITATGLAPGASKIVTIPVIVPEIIELSDGEGDYYLVATADYAGDVDEGASTDPVTIATPFQDLVPSFKANTLDSDIIPGDTGRVIVTVTNIGNIDAAGNIQVTLYASSDGSTVGATQLGDPVASAVNLAANTGSKDFVFNVEIPQLDVDDYQLIAVVEVIDGVNEDPADELNNEVVTDDAYSFDLVFGSFGDRNNESLTLTDPASGEDVLFMLRGDGFGRVTFNQAANAFDLALEGTTTSTRVIIRPVDRDAVVEVNDVTVAAGDTDGSLLMFLADDINLIGDFTVDGGVRSRLSLGDVADPAQQTISIGSAADAGNADKFRLDLGNVTDLTITSDTPIQLLNAESWTDADATEDGLTAPWIQVLKVDGVFETDMTLADNGVIAAPGGRVLTRAVIDGAVDGSAWDLSGSTASMTFMADVTNLEIVAVSINSAVFRGDMSSSTIDLSDPLNRRTNAINRLQVLGNMLTSSLTTLNNIGVVLLGGMHASNIFAGVNNGVTDLPGNGDFVAPDADGVQAMIKSFILKSTASSRMNGFGAGFQGLFSDSNVAAGSIRKAIVSDVDYTNGGVDFGFSADESITNLLLFNGRTKIGHFRNDAWLITPSVDVVDFNVEIV